MIHSHSSLLYKHPSVIDQIICLTPFTYDDAGKVNCQHKCHRMINIPGTTRVKGLQPINKGSYRGRGKIATCKGILNNINNILYNETQQFCSLCLIKIALCIVLFCFFFCFVSFFLYTKGRRSPDDMQHHNHREVN